MQPSQLANLPQKLQSYFYNMQNRIIADVARRIQKAGEITSTADYQLNKYLIMGGTTEQIREEIKRLTSKTDAEIADIYNQVINSDYVRYKEIYEQINGNFPSIADPENETLNAWITGIMEQTRGQIRNISESLGFMVPAGNGLTFTPLTNIYQKYVDAACMDVVTGSFDYNTVLKRTVKELSRSGIRAVDYASGQVNRAPVAVRRAVLTGVNQVSAKINEKVASDLCTEYFEVTAHAGARPSHAEWQGKVYKHSELVSVCGLGDVTGLCGANCRHAYYAFFPGISVRAYSDDDLQRIKDQDAKEETWLGKTYNGYERTQKARQYESTMRQQRSYIQALNEGGADPADIQAAQARYLNTMNEYKGFCTQMDMRPDMQRVYIDGLGRMSGGRIANISFTSSNKTNIIKTGARNPSGKAAEKHASLYYEEIRKRKSDITAIAKNSGFSIDEITDIKKFIFIDKHDLGGTEPQRFDPDYMIAQSWQRLEKGKFKKHDITLLNHEKMEHELMNKGLTQAEAHMITSQKYNYNKEAIEFYDKIKKYKKE